MKLPLYLSLLHVVASSSRGMTDPHLRLTALTTNPHTNTTLLQCWRFAAPLNISSTPGTIGSLTYAFASAGTVDYIAIPAHYNGGLHTAPAAQSLPPPLPSLLPHSPPASSQPTLTHPQRGTTIIADFFFSSPKRLVWYISGLAHITLPDSSDEAYIVGGANGLLVAADTRGTGHVSRYPGDETTVALTVPFAGGRVPAYEVLGEGACRGGDGVGGM